MDSPLVTLIPTFKVLNKDRRFRVKKQFLQILKEELQNQETENK